MNYIRVIDEIFSQITGERFDIKLWDGQLLSYGAGKKPAFTLVFSKELAAKRLLSQGALGFGEAYMDGSLDVLGDIEAYLKLRHQFKSIKPSFRLALGAFLAARNVPKNRSDQISYHYDLGNEFFGYLLDKSTMSYSCGLYKTGQESLAKAQRQKIEYVCELLNLPPKARILDLGSGWGGFAMHAARKHNWRVTGYTLSNKQLEYCEYNHMKHGAKHQPNFFYHDFVKGLPKIEYDAIVMLESIEHVGKANLTPFIRNLYQAVKPGGTVYIQTTGRYTPKSVDKWTLKYVFPGGYLPAKNELLSAAKASGFEVDVFVDDTQSYILTLTEWIKGLEKHQHTIESKYGRPFFRLWHLWMHGAKAAFEVGSMNLFRIKLTKPE